MTKYTSISLLFATCTLFTTLVFAESPAAMDEIETGNIEPVFIDEESEARPTEASASNDINTPNEVEMMPEKEQIGTRQSGTVLNVSEIADKPMRVRKLDFPRRGMTEDKVQNELGRPNEIKPAVGTPPISQWVYDDRIVYFEFATVVHVVAK